MKKALHGVLGLSVWALATSCNKMSDRPADGFLVQGKVENAVPGKSIALFKLTAQGPVLVDSVKADEDGKFRFIGKNDQLQFFQIKVYGQSEYFVAGNEDIEVKVSGKAPNAAIDVTAGDEQARMKPVVALFHRQQFEIEPMNNEYMLAVQNRDVERAQKYRGMMERADAHFQGLYKHLIDSLGPSYASFTAATRLDPNKYLGTLDTLASRLEAKYKGQAWAKTLSEQLTTFKSSTDAVKHLAAGMPAPAFKLPSTNGKQLGPETFKGKYLVLDFWASWCKPCRANSPQMVALYKTYHSKGVEFLGVSLDQQEKFWKKAIADDGYTWPQVWDSRMWDSPVIDDYRIKGIPHLVLIDKEGKMVARDLNPSSLNQALASVFQEGNKPAM